jgi:hypothetical protein
MSIEYRSEAEPRDSAFFDYQGPNHRVSRSSCMKVDVDYNYVDLRCVSHSIEILSQPVAFWSVPEVPPVIDFRART